MKPTIAIFLHQPKCSVQSGNGIIKALETHYNFKIFTKHELESDFFDNVDIVAFLILFIMAAATWEFAWVLIGLVIVISIFLIM
jgi:hypothetical protein